MNEHIANDIKQWRVDEGCSWRKVHENYQVKWVDKKNWWFNTAMFEVFGDKSHPHGNQLEGVRLCESAMGFLGEVVEDGWN